MMIQKFKRDNTPTYVMKSSRGLIASFLASNRVEENQIENYDVNVARKYLKKHEEQTEVVDVMFRSNQRYASSMSFKRYKRVAAVCIVQGVQYIGCDVWNEKLKNAMKHFECTSHSKEKDAKADYDEEKVGQHKQKTLKIIEEYLDEIIVDDYTYEMNTDTEDGLIELFITNENDDEENGSKLCYVIDPYIIHGNDIFLMDSKGVAIPFFKEDMISAIIYGKRIFETDWDEAEEYEFDNKDLYNVFDLSNCKKLKKFSVAEYHAFENKLLEVMEELQKRYPDIPRFRVAEFFAADEFTLISDKNVTSNRYYSNQVIEGKVIRVDCSMDQIQISEE